jgi:hypothetical protein
MKNIILLLLVLAAGYLAWDKYHPEKYFNHQPPPEPVAEAAPTPSPTPPPTPQEIVSGVINQPVVHADELALVYQKFPQLTESMLESKTIHLEGKVEHLEVTGIDQETAEIKLDTAKYPNIYVDDNLKLLSGGLNAQWKRTGDTIVLAALDGTSTPLSGSLFTVGQQLASTIPLRVHRCTASSIYFDVSN